MTDAEIEMVQRQVAELVGSAMRSMRAEMKARAQAIASVLSSLTTLRPLSELTEADGEVLWWRKDPHEGIRPKWPPPRAAGVVCLEGGALWKIHDPEAVDVSWAIGDDYWTPLPKVQP